MNMGEATEYKYQTLIDILAEMVKNYLINSPKQNEGEKNENAGK
ncbi:hypothetical protein [Bacillus salipaludis]|uniref:Uncharacterized protein n=1 Tax=Bacillus salipaludis TaxID=2547811 RepID=A0ABW8RE08_9BACI